MKTCCLKKWEVLKGQAVNDLQRLVHYSRRGFKNIPFGMSLGHSEISEGLPDNKFLPFIFLKTFFAEESSWVTIYSSLVSDWTSAARVPLTVIRQVDEEEESSGKVKHDDELQQDDCYTEVTTGAEDAALEVTVEAVWELELAELQWIDLWRLFKSPFWRHVEQWWRKTQVCPRLLYS